MRHLIRIFLLTLLILTIYQPCMATIQGGIDYKISIDYSKLDEKELQQKADFYYSYAIKTGNLDENMTSALTLYHILAHKNPENIYNLTKLGTLYDLIGKDRTAKLAFYDAIGINSQKGEPYFRLGNFYYRRELYKKALKMYKEAYQKEYSNHYETLYQIGDIYEKFGDTEAALKYLNLAKKINPNTELDNKILRVENTHKINNEYYSNTRIRILER